MQFDVFISYSSKNAAAANAVCSALEAANVRCWMAPRDILPSADWAASIMDAVAHCRIMVLIFSSHANASRQVRREVRQAFDHEVPILPFRIENVVPESSLEFYMGSVHWLDAVTEPLNQHLNLLTTSVMRLLPDRTPPRHDEADRNKAEASTKRLPDNASDNKFAARSTADPAAASSRAVASTDWVKLVQENAVPRAAAVAEAETSSQTRHDPPSESDPTVWNTFIFLSACFLVITTGLFVDSIVHFDYPGYGGSVLTKYTVFWILNLVATVYAIMRRVRG